MSGYARRKAGFFSRMSSTSSKHEERPALPQNGAPRPRCTRMPRGGEPGGARPRRDYGAFGVNAARRGSLMKLLSVVLAVGTFTQAAIAGEINCREIESTSGRLACYDARVSAASEEAKP